MTKQNFKICLPKLTDLIDLLPLSKRRVFVNIVTGEISTGVRYCIYVTALDEREYLLEYLYVVGSDIFFSEGKRKQLFEECEKIVEEINLFLNQNNVQHSKGIISYESVPGVAFKTLIDKANG